VCESLESLCKFSFLVHLLANVNATQQLPSDVELRVSWPLRVLFQAFANLIVTQNVKVLVLVPGEVLVEQCDHLARKAALRLLRLAFHEQDNGGLGGQHQESLIQQVFFRLGFQSLSQNVQSRGLLVIKETREFGDCVPVTQKFCQLRSDSDLRICQGELFGHLLVLG